MLARVNCIDFLSKWAATVLVDASTHHKKPKRSCRNLNHQEISLKKKHIPDAS